MNSQIFHNGQWAAKHARVPGSPTAGAPIQETSSTLILHLVDGLLVELERLTGHQVATEAALQRMSARMESLESELALLHRSQDEDTA